MNRILSGQLNRSPQTTHVPSRQREDFAEKLRAKPQKESGRAIVDQGAQTKGSVATASQAKNLGSPSEEGEKPMMSAGAIVQPIESASAEVSRGSGSALVARAALEGTSTPSIGLLSGTLTWSRVYPEHLVASGYLSMVDAQDCDGNTSSEPAAGIGLGADIAHSGKNAASSMIESGLDGGDVTSNFLFDASPQSIVSTSEASKPDSDPDVAVTESNAVVLADHFWAERLMRLTRDGDGQSTVWLRDYRLQAGDVEPVVERLRWHGRQEGVPIDRVVINGREVWCAVVPKREH